MNSENKNKNNKNNNENKLVLITGTPGVGKTTIADELNTYLSKKYNSKLIKINELAIENNLTLGKDLKKGYEIVDIDKLSKKLNELIDSFFNKNNSFENTDSSNISNSSDISNNPKIAIVEGHLSPLCDINVDISNNNKNNNKNLDFKVIVLRLNPNILQKRLSGRKYSEDKVYENLEAEALGVCSVEAYENHWTNIHEIDTSDLKVQEVLNLVEDVLFNKKDFPIGDVDFIHWILD